MPEHYQRPQPYEELDHTGDAGVVVYGSSKEETLARLILAFADLVTGGAQVQATSSRTVRVQCNNLVDSAIDVLRELLYAFDTEASVPESCEVLQLSADTGAEVLVTTGTYDPELHGEGLCLKAVTLHAARFEPHDSGYVASVVFDV
ncbi:MAG: archease [Myxococcales bacterium]|nr:archease [Myxococcales bacterium]